MSVAGKRRVSPAAKGTRTSTTESKGLDLPILLTDNESPDASSMPSVHADCGCLAGWGQAREAPKTPPRDGFSLQPVQVCT